MPNSGIKRMIVFTVVFIITCIVCWFFVPDKGDIKYTEVGRYLFSSFAQTMGAILAIALSVLYVVVSFIRSDPNHPESEAVRRLILKDSALHLSIYYGLTFILISLVGIFLTANTDASFSKIDLYVVTTVSLSLGFSSIYFLLEFLLHRGPLYFNAKILVDEINWKYNIDVAVDLNVIYVLVKINSGDTNLIKILLDSFSDKPHGTYDKIFKMFANRLKNDLDKTNANYSDFDRYKIAKLLIDSITYLQLKFAPSMVFSFIVNFMPHDHNNVVATMLKSFLENMSMRLKKSITNSQNEFDLQNQIKDWLEIIIKLNISGYTVDLLFNSSFVNDLVELISSIPNSIEECIKDNIKKNLLLINYLQVSTICDDLLKPSRKPDIPLYEPTKSQYQQALKNIELLKRVYDQDEKRDENIFSNSITINRDNISKIMIWRFMLDLTPLSAEKIMNLFNKQIEKLESNNIKKITSYSYGFYFKHSDIDKLREIFGTEFNKYNSIKYINDKSLIKEYFDKGCKTMSENEFENGLDSILKESVYKT